MSGQRDGLSAEERALRELWRELAEKGIEHGVDYRRIVLTLFRDLDDAARREAAAAAEAVEKALGPVSELADELRAAGIVSVYESAEELAEIVSAAVARGREEARR